jgi:ribose 5-phosphate isomerase B
MKIYIGADHRGFELKENVKKWLTNWGYPFEDMGAFEYNKDDDYPDFAEAVSRQVVANIGSRGLLICGSDIGIAVAANKIKGIRAGGATITEQVIAAVNDDDINVLSLGADFLKEVEAQEIVKAYLETAFAAQERHIRRIEKIKKLETEN